MWVALPLCQKKMPLQINVLVDKKETAVFKAARESLNLLLHSSKEEGVTLRQPCCAVNSCCQGESGWQSKKTTWVLGQLFGARLQ